MPQTQNKSVMKWLFFFTFIVGFLVVFGGYVRLTKSGLSIVEWNPISGIPLPSGTSGWEEEFAKYQLSPEYIKINHDMTLDGFKQIFLIEWIHRNIARLAGLAYAIPVFYYFFKNIIPRKEWSIYIIMGLLFIGQAIMGWLMVASGLVNRPAVSHIRLTLHLLLALTLFVLCLWTALGHKYGFPKKGIRVTWSKLTKLTVFAFIFLILQISYGGLVAGLKAGHLSNTWPTMFGAWLPPGLFSSARNLIYLPQTVFYVHRWLGFMVLLLFSYVLYLAKKQAVKKEFTEGVIAVVYVSILQITLGVTVVLFNVQLSLALIHQATAVVLVAFCVFVFHRFRELDRSL
jgi:heme a synthase